MCSKPYLVATDFRSNLLLWCNTTDYETHCWTLLTTVDIKSRWRHNWKLAQVVNSHLVCDPTIRQPGSDLPRQQWSLLNRFCTEQTLRCLQKEIATYRHWSMSLWQDPLTQTMSHIVESCPLTKLNGSLSRLHSADEDAVSWLTSYGSWNAYEKKKWRRNYYDYEMQIGRTSPTL